MDLETLASQLKKPVGELGKQVGQMMNKGNELINLHTIAELQLQPNDTVLEIGMGNGYFVKDVLNIHHTIRYVGFDYSELMVEEAKQLNQDFINNSRAQFHLGTANSLPYPDAFFSKIFTINTIYFWGDATKELAEIKRVLKPDGLFVIAIRSKETMQQMPFTEYGFVKYGRDDLEGVLQNNGFSVIRSIHHQEPPYIFNDTTISMKNIITICR